MFYKYVINVNFNDIFFSSVSSLKYAPMSDGSTTHNSVSAHDTINKLWTFVIETDRQWIDTGHKDGKYVNI